MNFSKLLKYKDKFFSNDRNIKVIVIVGLISIILIFFSELNGNKETPITKNSDKTNNYKNSDDYVEYIEEKIHKIVTSIENVGYAEIMVTLETTQETVYVQEERTNSDSVSTNSEEGNNRIQSKDTYEEKVVIVDKNGKKDALIKTTIEPTIKGVVIVCDTAEDPIVQNNIYNAITTALNISTARVSIIAGK